MKADRLKLVVEMAKKKTTSKMLVETTGLSHATISRMRAGACVTYDSVQKVARALSVEPAYLIDRND